MVIVQLRLYIQELLTMAAEQQLKYILFIITEDM